MSGVDAEIAVVGLGSIGSMALWQAASHSSSVLGIEAKTPADPRTAVGGDSRLFRMTYRGTMPYYPILQRSRQLWLDLEAESGRAIFGQCGGLSIGERSGDYIGPLLESIHACGATYELLDHDQMAERFPQHRLSADEVGVWDPGAGFLKTDTAVLGAIDAATARGAQVEIDSQVTAITEADDHVVIRSADRSWTARKVIVTGGAWAGRLLPGPLAAATYPARILLTWFQARTPADFRPEVFPIFIRIAQGTSMYGAPSLDGVTVKASLDGRSRPATDPSHLDRDPYPEETAEVRGTAATYFPGLIPYVVRADTYPDLYTTDSAPLLGFAPGSQRVVLATGFSGAGFKMATGYGAIAADLATGADPSAAPAFTDPTRFLSGAATR